MSITSLILNKDNEIKELTESETKFNEAVDKYVLTNAERIAQDEAYKAFEQSHRGFVVCSQLEQVARKGKEEFNQSMNKAKKMLDSQVSDEVKKYSFVEEIKMSYSSRFGRVMGVLTVTLFLIWLAQKGFAIQNEMNEVPLDTGTVAVEVPKAPAPQEGQSIN